MKVLAVAVVAYCVWAWWVLRALESERSAGYRDSLLSDSTSGGWWQE